MTLRSSDNIILIKNGLVYDGSKSLPFVADLVIHGDKIRHIGSRVTDGGTVIDASGLVVAPGFIDTHAHSDFTLLADPRAEGKVSQGITTEINGNCGMSAAPLYDKALERREEDLNELGIKDRWSTFREYFGLLESRSITVNCATLAGHGNIRGSAMGYDDRQPDAVELRTMVSMLEDSLRDGAMGLSTGLIYPPGVYSATEELVELSKCLHDRDLLYASHMRSEGLKLVEAVQEIIRIGRQAGAKVHISHIKTSGQQNWHKADTVIAEIEDALSSGVRITCDRYPYSASSTDLDSLLPAWSYAGGNEDELRRLTDEHDRERIRGEILAQTLTEDYWSKVIISSVNTDKNRWLEGKTINEVAKLLGVNEVDALFQLLIEERLRVGAIFLSMSEENLKKFISLPFCMVGSDSSARCFDGVTRRGKPHPRTFGTFPRLMGKYCRDEHVFSLSEAVHKATHLAAETFGIRGRGLIKEGMYADIVIFDPERIKDLATFENPFNRPEGIHFVLINGIPVLWDGIMTGNRPGRVLKGK